MQLSGADGGMKRCVEPALIAGSPLVDLKARTRHPPQSGEKLKPQRQLTSKRGLSLPLLAAGGEERTLQCNDRVLPHNVPYLTLG